MNEKNNELQLNPMEKELLNMMGNLNEKNNAIFLAKLAEYFGACFNELTDDCSCLVIKVKGAYSLTMFEDGWLIYLPAKYGYWRKIYPSQTNLMQEIFTKLLEIRTEEYL